MTAGAETEQLGSYLNDHLAGATAGLELARRCRDHALDAAARGELDTLATEVGADREALLGLMRRLGVRPDPIRRGLGWLAGQAARLRPALPFAGDPELARLLELEAMGLGVEGKRSLWDALRHTVAAVPAVAGLPLDELAARAARQREVLERHRLAAAAHVLVRAPAGPPQPADSSSPSDSTTSTDRLL